MRRASVLVIAWVALSGCGGTTGPDEVDRLRDEVDAAARIVAVTSGEALDADLPPGTDLGTGVTRRCKGSPDRVFYSIDTFVAHTPLDDADAAPRLLAALRGEGYDPAYVEDTRLVRVRLGDVVAEVVPTAAEGRPSVAHDIHVDTGCLRVGERRAAELVGEGPRPVRR